MKERAIELQHFNLPLRACLFPHDGISAVRNASNYGKSKTVQQAHSCIKQCFLLNIAVFLTDYQ
jgi:hypothetical protein